LSLVKRKERLLLYRYIKLAVHSLVLSQPWYKASLCSLQAK